MSRLRAGIDTWKLIHELGHDPTGKVFLEVGTGRAPNVPVAYWLMGARRTITMDMNPYLKIELIRDSLDYISDNYEEILELFGALLNKKRFDGLLHFYEMNPDFLIDSFLELCQIEYIAPGNAAKTGLRENSIDFHTSFTVLEHIPPEVLEGILEEGNRIINDDGLFVHRIDYSDHFSHSDKTISAINFLQYSDSEWERYAGNRYMYMNRLRHDDFLAILESAEHRILMTRTDVDERSLELLRSGGLQLDEQYKNKSEDVLSIVGSWVVSRKS
ncbi:hypothetical protein ACFL1X_10520 [Candidatus Hydrogenedentota bacterium]